MPTSLVTGCAGLLGSHVAERLLRCGHDVVGVDDLSGGLPGNIAPGVTFVHASVTDDDRMSRLFEQHRFDYVFHFAAFAAEGLSHFVRRHNYETNIGGSAALINAAIGAGSVRCFVFASSIAVYGHLPPPLTEDTLPRPIDPYGIGKLAIELDLQAAAEMFGLPFVVFRFHNVYGEGQNLRDPYRNVVAIFMRQVYAGRPVTIFGDGRQTRAFTYVRDIIPAIVESVRRSSCFGQTFNLGSDEVVSVSTLASMIGDAMGLPVEVEHLPPRLEAQHPSASHAKARLFFADLLSTTPLPEGLAAMANWLGQVGVPPPADARSVEISRGLPRAWAQLSGIPQA